MDHRVEPPSWLPEGAAPEGGRGPAPGDSTVSTDTDADKPSYNNGQDGTGAYEYAHDSPYTDSQDSPHKGNQEGYYGDNHAADDGQRDESVPGASDAVTTTYHFGLPPEEDPDDGTTAGGSGTPGAAATPFGQAAGATAAAGTPHGPEPGPYRSSGASPYSGAYGASSYGGPAGSYGPPSGAMGGGTAVGAAARPKQPAPPPRAANLVIARLEPWSVMKFSFLISIVAWIVLFVAVAILYYALSGLGVFAALQRTLSNVTSSQGSAGVNLHTWTSAPRVLGYTMLIGAVNVVLITALSTVGAMIYNLVTHLGGGIEVTLKETD